MGRFALIATVPVNNYTDASLLPKRVSFTAINQLVRPYCPDVAPVPVWQPRLVFCPCSCGK